jgi:RNase P subunit RPR2
MLLTTPQHERKKCFTCGKMLPRNNYFFATNNSRKDHFASNCKECEKKKRIEKGGQS